MSHGKGLKPASQKVVKVGMLQEEFGKFGKALLYEVATGMQRTENEYYRPRFEALEWAVKPWWKKLWIRLTVGTWLGKKKEEDAPQPEKAPETAVPEPETASEGPPQGDSEGDSGPKETPTEERQTRTCARCSRLFVVHGPERICPICVAEDNR